MAAGDGEVSVDGGVTVEFVPRADPRRTEEGVTFRYRLSVDVTDEGGETRSAERVFRLGFVTVEARLEQPNGFFDAGEKGFIDLRRMDLDGTPRAGTGSWRLLEVVQPDRTLLRAELPPFEPPGGGAEGYRTPGDLLRPRWGPGIHPHGSLAHWADGRELLRGEVETDEDGRARLRLPGLAPGVYRLFYETRDPWGARFETSGEFLVAEPAGTRLALPAVLIKERPAVAVGESIRLLVHSGLARQQMVLELLRGGHRIERRRLSSTPGLQIVEIPVTEAHRGGLGVRLTALRDHQTLTFSESVHVPWDDRRLDLSFATFRDLLRPGDRESWRVTVRGAGEEELAGSAAELLAYMYDRSLDLFAPHRPPRVSALYPARGAPRAVRHNLGVGREIWVREENWADLPGYPSLSGDRLVYYSGYGIGGPGVRFRGGRQVMEMRAMAVPEAAATDRLEQVALGNAAQPERLGGKKVPIADPLRGEHEPAESSAELR
ncbi:MAG: hypothetical protein ACE5EG_13400, partial [Thermoanaerobaculia bacterium]